MERQPCYSVQTLAQMAGVSPRTLRYYDQIGLLIAARNPENDYRWYGERELLRLQQILFYREIGLSLDEIRTILDQPDFDLLEALEQHRMSLEKRQAQIHQLIATVDRTLSHLKGNHLMESNEFFTGFSDEQQQQYEKEIQEKYGSDLLDESRRRWGSYAPEEKQRILKEGGEIYLKIVDAMPYGPGSDQAQDGIAQWHQNLRYFYEPTTEILLGLADMYNDQPEFAAFFERIHSKLNAFMREAVRIYCQNR